MNYLVTGATGLLGNNLVRLLVAAGEQVRVLVRQTDIPRSLESLTVEIHRGDIRDLESVRHAAAGVDFVLHAAGDVHIGWHGWSRQREINVEGARNVAIASRRAGARMIHVSSVDALSSSRDGVLVDETTPVETKVPCTYVVTKQESEAAVREQAAEGLDCVIVNPGFMLGPWDWKPSSGRMLLSVTQRWIPAAPGGGMSACDVRDVAAAILKACHHPQPAERYILAGENITFFDAWRLFAQTANRPAPAFRLGPVIPWIAGHWGDLLTRLSGHEGELNSAITRMSQLKHFYSSERARAELAYQSRPFAETVQDAWNWLVEYGYVIKMKKTPAMATER